MGPMVAMRKSDGFTLVELMVVVLLIGILVSIAIQTFAQVEATAEKRACQSNQRSIEGACQTYVTYNYAMWTGTDVFDGNATPNTVDLLAVRYFLRAPKCPGTKQFYYVDNTGTVRGDTGAVGWYGPHGHY